MEKKILSFLLNNLEISWKEALGKEFSESYFLELMEFLEAEAKSQRKIFPAANNVFTAFNKTPFDKVKVVILGQDPYHGAGQAHGLSFSVPQGIKPPPSLVNIFKEIESDIGKKPSGNLIHWAEQGVLLLNAILTVRESEPASHRNKGWEKFTDAVIKTLSDQQSGLVFLLWGRYAQEKEILIDHKKHHILKAAHPSPFSAHHGFFNSKHFSTTNEILLKQKKEPIDWVN